MLNRKMLFHQGLTANPVKTSAEDVRMNLGALWTPEGSGSTTKVREGVVAGGPSPTGFLPLEVVPGVGQLTVKPGRVVLQGTAANQGSYVGTVDVDQVRTVAGAARGAGLPPAGQFKAGRIMVRVYDQLYDGGTVDGWDVELHLGTAAATAAAAQQPSAVPTSFTLRTFTVDSTGAFTLGGAAPYTVPRGGITPVPRGDTDPGSYEGQYRDQYGIGLQRWSELTNSWEGISGWQNPVFRARQNSKPSLPSGVWTTMWWDAVDIDTHGVWFSARPTEIIIPRMGYYWIQAGFGLTGASSGRRIIQVFRNGVGEGIARAAWAGSGGDDIGVECSGLLHAFAGDVLTIGMWQDTGATFQVSSVPHSPTNVHLSFQRPT